MKYFGVSNYGTYQIQLLQKYLKQPIVTDQMQFSLLSANLVASGLNVNMTNAESVDHDGGLLDFCRLNSITVQTWSPLQYGFFEGAFVGNDKFPQLNQKLLEIAEKYHVTGTTVAIAWILRHPAKMQPVIGTMNLNRLNECLDAADVCLTNEEWYALYRAAGHFLP